MNTTLAQPELRLPIVSIAVISAATLAYEVLLTRLFSIVQWHHFTYMVISIALLGFGASGTFLTFNSRLVERFVPVYIINVAMFGLLALPCFLFAQRFAVNPEQLLWQPTQMIGVTVVYLLLALPFFFAANALGLSLMRFHGAEPLVYAADLIGAGLGSIAIVGLLYLIFPMDALKALAFLGLLAASIGAFELRAGKCVLAMFLIIALGLQVGLQILPGAWISLTISPYKSLPQQLNVVDSSITIERSSPLGLLNVVSSPTVPIRHAPGLSLNADDEIPVQLGVFTDGDAMTPIDAAGELSQFGYLDAVTSALPYHLTRPERVVVLGAGGGSLVRQALYHSASSITAVELNPQMVKLVREDFREFSGDLYDPESIDVRIEEARGFFSGNPHRYDLIQVELIDSFAASSAGLLALNESYLYTVEAFGEYLASLATDGYLAISRWVKLPPRDTLKLFATAVEALRQSGVVNPAEHLLLIRGWQTSTLVVKKGQFTAGEIAATQRFCNARSFDLAFYSGMPESRANRYNVLSQPFHYRGAQALLGNSPEQFFNEYKFNIRPSTDDRPYFFYYFKWRTLPEIVSLFGQGGVPLLESGYLILIATLIQSVFISVLLIVFPLWKRMRATGVRRRRMTWYFGALGFAFFFVEISFIQKFLLFLHHPVLSVAATLGGFLVFAGVGSYIAGRLHGKGSGLGSGPGCNQRSRHQIVFMATVAIVTLGLLYGFVLPSYVFQPLADAAMPVKLIVSVMLTGLLAIPMGMPFPLGIARLGEQAPSLVPVAWAINGCASVISAVLATVLAIHFGFTVVLLIAFALYVSALAAFDF